MEKGNRKLFICLLPILCTTIFSIATTSISNDHIPSEWDMVAITPVAIKTPNHLFLLIRQNTKHCALRFTKSWTGKTDQDHFAECQTFFQGDNTGDFTKPSVVITKHSLSFPKPRGIGRLAFSFGRMDFQCGSIDLYWVGDNWIKFFPKNNEEGYYGLEIAPTKWTDISQVNVFDPRLKWYRYDPKRSNVEIPVEDLWPERK